MNPIINLPVEHYLDLIRDNKPFSFSRFGDGEALCMQLAPHWLKENCDGSKFLPEIADPMKQIFVNQHDYYHCLIDCSFDLNGNVFRDFLETTCPDMDFYNGEIWQHLSFDGRILELIELLNEHKFCLIGGEHLKNFQHMKGLDFMGFIEIPSKDSFLVIDRIQELVLSAVESGYDFFGICAGYTTKILIDRLFPIIGDKVFLVDFGSAFDPFCGRLSRDGMRAAGKHKFQPFTNFSL